MCAATAARPRKFREFRVWREGDELKEREYLTDQHRQALAAFRKSDSELKQVEVDCRSAQASLHKHEEYMTALANYLDGDAEGGQTESVCKKRLYKLEGQLRETEAELQDVKAVHHPAVASGLHKEKGYLLIENQRAAKAADLAGNRRTPPSGGSPRAWLAAVTTRRASSRESGWSSRRSARSCARW